MIETVLSGSLFTNDWLTETIAESDDWKSIDDEAVSAFEADIRNHFDKFPIDQTPNETQTEDDLIWKVLASLGWDQFLRQQNLSVKGRTDIPDGLLFPDAEAKDKANSFPEEYKRYEYGSAVVESKRWKRPLDRASGKRGEELAPSTQMLRYLRRVDDLTSGNLRWGILTNGGRWRLYWQGARSVSEQYFEIDLAAVLGLAGHGDGLFQLNEEQRYHALRVFMLMFRREAFLPASTDQRTFHERALEAGKVYEERVANDLSNLVFNQVFPLIVRSIADHAPKEDLQDVREAGLILLYRLLFILYAEDRDLLPVNDDRYDDYGLRKRVRQDVGERKDRNDTFSTTAARYWAILDDLCRAIDKGDASIGLPPYNGGLFDEKRTPILTTVRLPDSVMSDVIDKLSFIQNEGERKYINYRDLTVQQLGSIYERLLEHEVIREDNTVQIRPNIFARKGSGSYYTPDDLVNLIITETLEPLVERKHKNFVEQNEALANSDEEERKRLLKLKKHDPALALLDLKICDPAMGSGHFLVSLVDYLTDQVINAMAEAETIVEWTDEYTSPLSQRIEEIRETIIGNAEDGNWVVDEEQLDDRHIIRRMVLKRCVYGVDKNVMAVELAKVALWLHSFTVGAPLSFLDHHLRCGDSLFGSWVNKGIEVAEKYGSPLLIHEPVREAIGSAAAMREIEKLPDAEIADAKNSAQIFDGIQVTTAPLNGFLSYIHGLSWLNLKNSKENKVVLQAFFDGEYGDAFAITKGKIKPKPAGRKADGMQLQGKLSSDEKFEQFEKIHVKILKLVEEENFFNWQVAFPGVWHNWEEDELQGGFDAIIGNPPWDRFEFEEIPWFVTHARDIAMEPKASKRKKRISQLRQESNPLWEDYLTASNRMKQAANVAKKGGDYSKLISGKLNIYKLFVERAFQLIKPEGIVGLLVPSGISSDKSSSGFFKEVATRGRLRVLYDFENRRSLYNLDPFFPDVDTRFKFCVFVADKSPHKKETFCGAFLQSVLELKDKQRKFSLSARDFSMVNPNTGTAPIFKTKRDAELTTKMYSKLPVITNRSQKPPKQTWEIESLQMINMTSDSEIFRTLIELQEHEKAYRIENNRFKNENKEWVSLYEGKMVQAYDHRAANIVVNPDNQYRPAQPEPATILQHQDQSWTPSPQFFVPISDIDFPFADYLLGFKDVTAPTNMRSMIAAIIPNCGVGNTMPIIIDSQTRLPLNAKKASLILGNMNSIPMDFIARQKIQGQHLNWFIVEQLPVIPIEQFETTRIGSKTAAECVRECVLELTYTAHDMEPFARDMGFVDDNGEVKPPFIWNEERRLRLRAKLDAIFFNLYGITDREDIRYIYSTFPIVERQEKAEYERYLSRDLCLAYMNVLAAGNPDDEPVV